jgi:hypothetical protein
MDRIWKVAAIPPFLKTPLVPIGTPIAELSAPPRDTTRHPPDSRWGCGRGHLVCLGRTHQKTDWLSTIPTIYATLTHPTVYSRAGHTVQRNHNAKQYNALAEAAQRIMPITIRTCVPPHVYHAGKPCSFSQNGFASTNWNPYHARDSRHGDIVDAAGKTGRRPIPRYAQMICAKPGRRRSC